MRTENAASKEAVKVTVAHVPPAHQARDPAQRQVSVEGSNVAAVAGLEAAVLLNQLLQPAVEVELQYFISTLKIKFAIFRL